MTIVRKGMNSPMQIVNFVENKSAFELNGNCCGDGYCRRYVD